METSDEVEYMKQELAEMRGVQIRTRVTSEVCAENVKVNRNIIRTYLSEIGISQSPE